MTLLPLSAPVGPVRAVPVPSTALPVQRASTDTLPPPDLCAVPVAADRALSGAVHGDRDAVTWLSAHIATLDRVIYPAAGRYLRGSDGLRAQRAATHRLALLVRRLHGQLDGNGAAVREDVPALRRAVLAALREYSLAERDLLTRLREALTARQWTELTGRYAEHLRRGPTRPHPHARRTGVSGRAAYRLATWADHVLDVLDSRAVRPVPMTTAPAA